MNNVEKYEKDFENLFPVRGAMLNCFQILCQGSQAGSQSLIFDFPFVRPYKVTFCGIFDQKGIIKYYFFYKMIHISQNELFKFSRGG